MRAVQSVLAQTYQNFEIVVVDDVGVSSDCVGMDPRIKYVQIDRNRYVSHSRNVGLQNSSGELIAFLDDDDIWASSKLSLQIQMIKDPLVVMCCSNMFDVFDVSHWGTLCREHFPWKHEMDGNLLNEAILRQFVWTSTVITRKSIINALGGFYVHPDLTVGEDTDMWLRIATTGNIYYGKVPLVERRIHPGNLTKDLYSTKEGRIKTYRALRLCNERLLGMDIPALSKFYAWLQVWNNIIKIQKEQLI